MIEVYLSFCSIQYIKSNLESRKPLEVQIVLEDA